jgi:hypothetical protein
MAYKGLSKHKPLQSKDKPLSKNKTRRDVSSVGSAHGLLTVDYREPDVQIMYGPPPSPFVAISEDASLMEEFFANDSLGG